ncbi:MAG: nidogen-like domain-containing protein, partial [Ignavibacteria bacterium]
MKGKFIALFLALALVSSSFVFAQDVSSPDYQAKKEALIGVPYTPDLNTDKAPVRNENSIPFLTNCPESDRPTCLKEPFDATAPGWVVSMPRNDDGSSVSIPLPFTFNLYGTNFNSIFINNNGNITFTAPLATFTPFGFPSTPLAIVAPFFADVDTRPLASGLVYHKIESNRMTIVWDSVGYFGNQVDKRNTFQLIISDGTDPLLGIGNNVCFSYGDMAWTTGSASGGIGGFFGSPATVGVNKGDGATFATLGRFNRPGSFYGGPGVDTNGVSYLDCRSFCLNASNASNLCPVAQNFPGGNVNITAGNPYMGQYGFAAPEISQIVSGGVTG